MRLDRGARTAAGVLALTVAGCVWDADPFDPRQYGVGSGCDVDEDCADGLRCGSDGCTAGCVDDDECDGAYACAAPGDQPTGADGCWERCDGDDACKGGYVCDGGGACVERE